MVPLDRASSYRLSVVTTSLCAAVWRQLSMQKCNLLVAVSQKQSAHPIATAGFLLTLVQQPMTGSSLKASD